MQWLGHDLTLKWKQNLSRTFNIKKSNAKVDTYMCMYQIIYWSQIDLLWQCWKRKTAASTVTIVTRLLRWWRRVTEAHSAKGRMVVVRQKIQNTKYRSARCKGQDGCCCETCTVAHCLKRITVKKERKLWGRITRSYTQHTMQSSCVRLH